MNLILLFFFKKKITTKTRLGILDLEWFATNLSVEVEHELVALAGFKIKIIQYDWDKEVRQTIQ